MTDASDKLRLAFSDLQAIDCEVAALASGVGVLPLPEAAGRVLRGAKTAATVASTVLKAAEAAEAAAGKAAAVMTAAEEANAVAERAATEAAEAVTGAAQTAGAATLAAATLEVKIEPPVPSDHK